MTESQLFLRKIGNWQRMERLKLKNVKSQMASCCR